MSPTMSMTGFGRAESSSDLGVLSVEIKSVNHRFLEPRLYLPRDLGALELPLLRVVKERLTRGKVDVSVRWQPAPGYVPKASFNAALAQHYAKEIESVGQALGVSHGQDARATSESRTGVSPVSLEFLLQLPGVQQPAAATVESDQALAQAAATLNQAIDAIQTERRREGLSLENDLLARLDALRALKREIEKRSGEVVETFRAKLAKKAAEWAQSASIVIDSGRLETEVLLFAERSDITEELVRLETHIDAFRAALSNSDPAPQGKTMEFLTQELLRETNTVASKARDSAVASATISMKNEIEKIREQVMNIE